MPQETIPQTEDELVDLLEEASDRGRKEMATAIMMSISKITLKAEARPRDPGSLVPTNPEEPTIREALDVLFDVMKSVKDPIPDVLKIVFAGCDDGKTREILYAFLDEPREESQSERVDRMAAAAAAWGPTALKMLQSEPREFLRDTVGVTAAAMASGARRYFESGS